ncbi:MAG TPA: GerMN domain-containing protein [Acidimicrobiia bacterium]|nr:GerMN domain-containing protein [Acidimicrobiia bacterium]
MKTRLVILIAALLLAGACSAPLDSGPKTLRAASIPADLREETSSTTTTIVSTGDSVEVTVYLIGGDRLVPVKRQVSPPVSVQKVLQSLFTPPTTAELVSGLRTAISPDTAVLGAPVEDRIATVNVSKNFAFGPATEQIIAFAQVVFTATEVDGVTGVLFAQNGHRQDVPQGDGSSKSLPLGRASYSQFTPR